MYTISTPLGRLLERAEARRGLTRGAAADTLGISRAAYLAWKRGTRPKLEHLPRIAAFCGISVVELLRALELDPDGVHELEEVMISSYSDEDRPDSPFGAIPGYHHSRRANARLRASYAPLTANAA